MSGLLYKDFISLFRIKKINVIWILVILSLAYIALRIIFAGTLDMADFVVIDEEGETVNLLDVIFIMFFVGMLPQAFQFLGVSKIMGNDEKNKIKDYLSCMPIEKNIYIASKYIFVGVSAYVAFAWIYILGITCTAFCRPGRLQDISAMISSLTSSVIFLMLLLAAIEFPLYVRFGKEKAMRVMIVFWTTIALFVLGYLMFGDLSIVDKIDIKAMKDFLEEHRSGVLIFQALEPATILVLYYLSYRLSCYLYGRKED